VGQLDRKKRIAFGARVNHSRQLRGECTARKLERQQRANFVFRQERKRQLARNASRLEIELEREKRMLRKLKLRRPECGYREKPVVAETREDVRKQVDGRRICPVYVLDEKHERLSRADRRQKSGKLALESFL